MSKPIELKIIVGKQSKRCSLHPPKGQEWTKDGAYRVMSEYVNDLVNKTGQEFRVARVGKMAFNVIHLEESQCSST